MALKIDLLQFLRMISLFIGSKSFLSHTKKIIFIVHFKQKRHYNFFNQTKNTRKVMDLKHFPNWESLFSSGNYFYMWGNFSPGPSVKFVYFKKFFTECTKYASKMGLSDPSDNFSFFWQKFRKEILFALVSWFFHLHLMWYLTSTFEINLSQST